MSSVHSWLAAKHTCASLKRRAITKGSVTCKIGNI